MIKTPNVRKSQKIEEEASGPVYRRKPLPDPEDLERYADIITVYRELLRLSALAPEIKLGDNNRRKVPEDREDLLQWVSNTDNLELVAESFRRTCSGYVTAGRLFAINHGPVTRDWPVIISMVRTAEDLLRNCRAIVEISGRGELDPQVERLREALSYVAEVREDLQSLDSRGELPPMVPSRISPEVLRV